MRKLASLLSFLFSILIVYVDIIHLVYLSISILFAYFFIVYIDLLPLLLSHLQALKAFLHLLWFIIVSILYLIIHFNLLSCSYFSLFTCLCFAHDKCHLCDTVVLLHMKTQLSTSTSFYSIIIGIPSATLLINSTKKRAKYETFSISKNPMSIW